MHKTLCRTLADVAAASLVALTVVALGTTASATDDPGPAISQDAYSTTQATSDEMSDDLGYEADVYYSIDSSVTTVEAETPTVVVTAPVDDPATLAVTGSESAWQLGVAIALALAGFGLVRAARRSRHTA